MARIGGGYGAITPRQGCRPRTNGQCACRRRYFAGVIDTGILTAGLTGVAALSGVLVSVLADGLKDRRRSVHERALREEDRRAAASDRRRTFELENLISAYDGLWLLAREAAKTHQADVYAAKNTEHGYGGTLLPAGTEVDLSQTSQAVKSIRLILNDDVRRLALDARDAMTAVSMLGLRAKMFQTGPVSLAEGEAAMADATHKVDAAMEAISEQIRTLMAQH